jgi:hypothetical protein
MGSGTIGGAATVNGMLNPGNSPGTLNFDAALTLGSNSTTTLEIATVSYDVLKNDGIGSDALTFNSGATIVFDFTANSNAVKGATFHVMQNWSSIVTNGAVFQTVGLADAALFGELDAGTGIVTVIPEPATIGMLGLGALVTIMIRRMRTA